MATRREDLERLRTSLWEELDAGSKGQGLNVPAISKEIRAVWEELEALPAEVGVAPADQIKAKREERRRKAAG